MARSLFLSHGPANGITTQPNGDAKSEDMTDRKTNSGFSALAQRAIGSEHVNGHDLHKLSSRHSTSSTSGSDTDTDAHSHGDNDRPKFERAAESQHISKHMPDSGLSRSKREKIERIRKGSEDGVVISGYEPGMDDARRRDIEKAGAKLRNAFGIQDGDAREKHERAKKRQEEDEEKRQVEMKKAERVPQSLVEQKNQEERGKGKDDHPQTTAEKGQSNYLEPNGNIQRQPTELPSYETDPPDDVEQISDRRKRKNEVGDSPGPLAPTKDMAKPGPRNVINLKPRLPFLHVSLRSSA